MHMCVKGEKKETVKVTVSQLSKGASPHWKTWKPPGKGAQGGNGNDTLKVHPTYRSLWRLRSSYDREEDKGGYYL